MPIQDRLPEEMFLRAIFISKEKMLVRLRKYVENFQNKKDPFIWKNELHARFQKELKAPKKERVFIRFHTDIFPTVQGHGKRNYFSTEKVSAACLELFHSVCLSDGKPHEKMLIKAGVIHKKIKSKPCGIYFSREQTGHIHPHFLLKKKNKILL